MVSFDKPLESASRSEIEITVTLVLKYYNQVNEWKVISSYQGKSTRRVTRKQKSEDELTQEKVEMKEEAKKAALMECFRERFGFTEFNDMVFDELHRPMNA